MGAFERNFSITHLFRLGSETRQIISGHGEKHFGVEWGLTVMKGFDFKQRRIVLCKIGWGLQHNKDAVGANFSFFSVDQKGIRYPLRKVRTLNEMCFVDPEDIYDGNKFHLHVDVKILWIKGLERTRLKDFTQKCEDPSVISVFVNDDEFYVSKDVLTRNSPFMERKWKTMIERSKNQRNYFEFNDINPDIFHDILELLYGYNALTDDNVVAVSEMAYDLQFESIKEKCEEYLVGSQLLNDKEKFQHATKFDMPKLRDSTLENAKYQEDLQRLLPENVRNLDLDTSHAVLERMKIVTTEPPRKRGRFESPSRPY